MQKDIDYIKSDLSNLRNDMREMFNEKLEQMKEYTNNQVQVSSLRERAVSNESYASKETEVAVISLDKKILTYVSMWMGGIAVLGVLFSIVKDKLHL